MEKESLFYAWDRAPYIDGRWMDRGSLPKEVWKPRWLKGVPIEISLPQPIQAQLQPLGSGMAPHVPEFMSCLMPIFRDDLIQALQEIGVDNLQLFDLVITDPDNGTEYTNYKAVNILGSYAVADMQKSIPYEDIGFDKLVLDESKLQGLPLMFRSESMNILVHRKVTEYLTAKGFDGLIFYNVKDIAT